MEKRMDRIEHRMDRMENQVRLEKRHGKERMDSYRVYAGANL